MRHGAADAGRNDSHIGVTPDDLMIAIKIGV